MTKGARLHNAQIIALVFSSDEGRKFMKLLEDWTSYNRQNGANATPQMLGYGIGQRDLVSRIKEEILYADKNTEASDG